MGCIKNPRKITVNQLEKFADIKNDIGLPSKNRETNNNIGPENTQSQVIKANAPIFLLKDFAITAPRDQVKAPHKTNKTPIYFPSRLGAPVKINTPTKAIIKPIIFLTVGISFNKKNAITIPKGTSNITRSTAEEASIIFKPV